MPKKRDEFKSIGQAERERAVIESVKSKGMATINEVVEGVARRFELDLSDEKAKDAFSKSIRIFLQKSAEERSIFGRAYFQKDSDSPEKIPDEDVKRDKNGKVKNIYRIKYYILGSDEHVSGGDLILKFGGSFFPSTNSNGSFSVDWQVEKFSEIKPQHFYLVFRVNNEDCISINASVKDGPFSLIVGRRTGEQRLAFDINDMNQYRRSSLFLWSDGTVSSPKDLSNPGHAVIHLDSKPSISVEDLNSTNGTYFILSDSSDVTRLLKTANTQNRTVKPDKFIPNQYLDSWTKLKPRERHVFDTSISSSQLKAESKTHSEAFLKFGSFEVFIFLTR